MPLMRVGRCDSHFCAPLDDRVKLPSDPSRKVKGVDVLPWVLSPLMGPEEIDMEASRCCNELEALCSNFTSGFGEPARDVAILGPGQGSGA